MMKCPACGASALAAETRDLRYIYKGKNTLITAVKGNFCAECGECVVDPAHAQTVSEAMLAFNKQVNVTLVDPAFIVSVRKKLKLDQREAGEVFGGGANAFSRYENGKTRPPVALVKLLKVLDRHPEQLMEIR